MARQSRKSEKACQPSRLPSRKETARITKRRKIRLRRYLQLHKEKVRSAEDQRRGTRLGVKDRRLRGRGRRRVRRISKKTSRCKSQSPLKRDYKRTTCQKTCQNRIKSLIGLRERLAILRICKSRSSCPLSLRLSKSSSMASVNQGNKSQRRQASTR